MKKKLVVFFLVHETVQLKSLALLYESYREYTHRSLTSSYVKQMQLWVSWLAQYSGVIRNISEPSDKDIYEYHGHQQRTYQV